MIQRSNTHQPKNDGNFSEGDLKKKRSRSTSILSIKAIEVKNSIE
jgi:hypothetical protein